jgi:GT2 family glycosyltransferase
MSETTVDGEYVDFLNFDTTRLSDPNILLFPGALRAVVAIPVHNEEERIEACLRALGAQHGHPPGDFGLLLHLNNCTDRTESIVRSVSDTLPCPVRLLIQTDIGANAGWARRCAMDAAADWLAEHGAYNGIILTTDADSRVPPNWVRSNLAYIEGGADAVAGRIILDEAEAANLPAALHKRGALESAYESLLTEIDATLDPQDSNPWPCHWTCSGATLSVRRDVYLRVGGLPAIPVGEDRAFVLTLRAHNARVRHAPDIVTITSGRLEGRAPGGAADTIRARCENPESLCDQRLESVWRIIGRSLLRRLLRRAYREGRLAGTPLWMFCLGIPEGQFANARHSGFDDLHARIEAASPLLVYRPIRPRHLAFNIRAASIAVKLLRFWAWLRREGYRGGMRWSGIGPGLPQTKMRAE